MRPHLLEIPTQLFELVGLEWRQQLMPHDLFRALPPQTMQIDSVTTRPVRCASSAVRNAPAVAYWR
jgi:hypothetical protein